jgi:dTDP-4-amino-4,6-dideoxygalactose transaminase
MRVDVMTKRSVPYVNLAAQYAAERDELLPLIDRTLATGQWIGGDVVAELEGALADYCNVKHAIAVNSGTDALVLALKALGIGPGDEVITPPNSFIASTSAIIHVGAKPVFADVLADQNVDPERIEAAITPRTRAIMPVHLTGRIAAMDAISRIAADRGLAIVEDAAQAMGSRYHGRPSGSIGTIGCFSTHPLKNLNACGDGGVLTTNDEAVAERVRLLRNHGLADRDTVTEFGFVSRMDALQAAVIKLRLGKLDQVIARRRRNAETYRQLLDPERVFMPKCRPEEFNTFHTFVIQVDRRDALKAHLADHGIATAIHYPVPIHLQPAAAGLGYGRGDFPSTERQAERILTLPVNEHLDDDDLHYVAEAVNGFFATAGRASARRDRGGRVDAVLAGNAP